MNKTLMRVHARTLFSFAALSALITACVWPAPATRIENTPVQTSLPATIQTNTEATTTPTVPPPSSLVFPHITGDAGNFALLAGETITFTWENAPTGADKYEFVVAPLNGGPSFVVGTDLDVSDGVSISWTIPEQLAAELRAIAYFPDGRTIESLAPMIYSGDLPPAGVCSLIARHQPVDVYRLPDRTAETFALLYPNAYAHVLEIAPDGWYRIDAGAAMGPRLSPASGDGWVNSDNGILLTGSCPP